MHTMRLPHKEKKTAACLGHYWQHGRLSKKVFQRIPRNIDGATAFAKLAQPRQHARAVVNKTEQERMLPGTQGGPWLPCPIPLNSKPRQRQAKN